ncbi:hypothetical protein NPIL_148731 [Nephila pilipes]|uniref:Uncharacterized protein n=1 Tax=Nephila pilipes TaxID=299642 RepID=A0A8X6Q034_NEPPI|nr:hypothetical protein NPIL_148731 [Nephila pilipes]
MRILLTTRRWVQRLDCERESRHIDPRLWQHIARDNKTRFSSECFANLMKSGILLISRVFFKLLGSVVGDCLEVVRPHGLLTFLTVLSNTCRDKSHAPRGRKAVLYDARRYL